MDKITLDKITRLHELLSCEWRVARENEFECAMACDISSSNYFKGVVEGLSKAVRMIADLMEEGSKND